jgi:hypothetical protein
MQSACLFPSKKLSCCIFRSHCSLPSLTCALTGVQTLFRLIASSTPRAHTHTKTHDRFGERAHQAIVQCIVAWCFSRQKNALQHTNFTLHRGGNAICNFHSVELNYSCEIDKWKMRKRARERCENSQAIYLTQHKNDVSWRL